LQEILLKAGLPEGVFEVVTGSGSVTGEALLEHAALEMLFFTGSTEVGRKVYTKAAERLKPAIMELGGKDPAIVTKNADIKRAVHSIAWGAFTNCGQTCIGMEICLVERAIFDEFLSEFLSITRSLKCGQQVGGLVR
jgi:acyl-CoA reductase-like NAD-dependent aldehyde dehydrogenase